MTAEPEPTGKVIRLNVGGTQGKLSTRVGSQIPVRVYERGDFLMLVLMLDAAEELTPDAADELSHAAESLVVEYVSPRGWSDSAGRPCSRRGTNRNWTVSWWCWCARAIL